MFFLQFNIRTRHAVCGGSKLLSKESFALMIAPWYDPLFVCGDSARTQMNQVFESGAQSGHETDPYFHHFICRRVAELNP